jgi:hypothetical protein
MTDDTHGGGHIPVLVVSPKAKKAFQSVTMYEHQSALRLTMEGLGVTKYPGTAATAPDMSEFF